MRASSSQIFCGKQSVAIAKVVLRSPKILLLVEAITALDADNEREVQLTLDFALTGRNTVNVAHRIDTIKNSMLFKPPPREGSMKQEHTSNRLNAKQFSGKSPMERQNDYLHHERI